MFARRAFILLYHRVADLSCDPHGQCVSGKHFEEQLLVLTSEARIVPISKLLSTVESDSFFEPLVAITFDDGYADNLHNAKPLLERYDAPATVFVASDHVGLDRELWWDNLERLLLQSGTLPNDLHLTIAGEACHWSLDDFAHYTEDACRRYRSWTISQHDVPTTRHKLYLDLLRLLRPLSGDDKRRILDELASWSSLGRIARASHRVLTEAELVDLDHANLVEVGAHTRTHPVLAALTPKEQQEEIEGSATRLEEILGRPVKAFAYPYGWPGEYSATTIELVRNAGFSYACCAFPGEISRRTDRLELPRFLVRNWNGDEFLRGLGTYLSR